MYPRYPQSRDSGASCGQPRRAQKSRPQQRSITNVRMEDCGLNFSTSYWLLVYVEGPLETRAGVLSPPVEVKVPPSMYFKTQPVVVLGRPFEVWVNTSAPSDALLWMIVVKEELRRDGAFASRCAPR